ncbi:uncharacterized protein LOC124162359 [Ischnura elegans]|uniref:uncharacterized protein LOC124162359 n=1 Tax=Ischnura elegans TaxID=197161 RepID=UPI001ED89613|nr:uncharacterized protein LOC124162359 [Ischnura elegans]
MQDTKFGHLYHACRVLSRLSLRMGKYVLRVFVTSHRAPFSSTVLCASHSTHFISTNPPPAPEVKGSLLLWWLALMDHMEPSGNILNGISRIVWKAVCLPKWITRAFFLL